MGWARDRTHLRNNKYCSLKKVLFLTFNDAPSGIYSGQVIDVCRFLAEEGMADVKLVAFISARNFKKNKQQIITEFPGAVVRRMVPFIRNWKWNKYFLRPILRRENAQVIIARGPFAVHLALESRRNEKIVFDARGAYIAEFSEYKVAGNNSPVAREIPELEKQAVLGSDQRIAVSNELVGYWKRSFGYSSGRHEVIPCTLNTAINVTINGKRKKDFPDDHVVIAFSGGSGGWQSLQLMQEILRDAMRKQEKLCLLLLVKHLPEDFKLAEEFPGRVVRKWVEQKDVNSILASCDYGWLVREKSVTNKVASPVKFAEYLFAGLPVIISEGLGDFTEFVLKQNAGVVWNEKELPRLGVTSDESKQRMNGLAREHFLKPVFRKEYSVILS